MRLLVGFAAILILVSACTSDGSDGPGTSGNPPTVAASTTPTTAPSSEPTTATPTSKSAPATPTVPADVPTTGPNTKPGETPPVLPVIGTTRTRAGAKAFAEFFIKTIDWAYATMSPAYLRHFSSSSCRTCSSLIKKISSDQAAGYRYIGGRFTPRSVRAVSKRSFAAQLVTVDVLSFQKVDAKNDFVEGDQAHAGLKYSISLTWAGTGFRVREVAVSL